VAPALHRPPQHCFGDTAAAVAKESGMSEAESGVVKIQFMPVGRHRREWMWKARDESNTITISGQRFDTLEDAVRDARAQITGSGDDSWHDDDPDVA
jgi:hypothetical protein